MSPERLPAPWGSLIDRDQPVRFHFEGKPYRGFAGDTIASALAAEGELLLSRSFKYHRPRGVLTMAGRDANTMVQVGSEPNVRADRRAVTDGLAVRGQNYKGTLAADRWASTDLLARFLPAGFYYKAFFRPRGSWHRFWEPIFRARAGLGTADPAQGSGDYDKRHLFTQVAVIGGGLAGLSAAVAAVRAGARVTLVEEMPALGGAAAFARLDVDGAAGRLAQALVAEVRGLPGVTIMTDAQAAGLYADNWIPIQQGNRLYKLRADQVVLASGALEQPVVFGRNDLPGIMLGTAAQRLMRLYGVLPGRRAVVVAGEDRAYGVALDLAEAGAAVTVLDLRAAPAGPLQAAAAAAGIPVRTGMAPKRALGDGRIEALEAAAIAGPGRLDEDCETLACDLLCLSPGEAPDWRLPVQAGFRLSESAGRLVLEGSADNLHLAGRLAGVPAGLTSAEHGRQAGADAAASLHRTLAPAGRGQGEGAGAGGTASATPAPSQPPHPDPLPAGAREEDFFPPSAAVFPHPDGKDFVDFDEDLTSRDISTTVAEGYAELELVKRFSTLGMGPSQGRQSAVPAARLVAEATGRAVAQVGVTNARPPFAPVKLGLLAGRGFDPERRTPMHRDHLALGARMMPAGAWARPAYYGTPANRAAAIEAEVRAVREAAGLIDVSTLGKLELRGPEAGAFLERIYTGRFAKQRTGRLRYALLCAEDGAILDDGVALRLEEDRYYVTATTGAVDRVYRMMLHWNARWRMNVDIANFTAARAAVSLAGPRAREVLAAVVPDFAIDAGAMPYLAGAEGHVAGVPVVAMRLGFVGELGWELHVPAGYGSALWRRLLDAGAPLGLQPVGIEAQRVLRLEKGHVVVSQDTDAVSTPQECAMGWAVAESKPDFLGKAALRIRSALPQTRLLVGIELQGRTSGLDESCLLLDRADAVVGHVTSIAWSPTLGRTIGLAWAPPASRPGDPVLIRLTDGSRVTGSVAALPFYDPAQDRQAL